MIPPVPPHPLNGHWGFIFDWRCYMPWAWLRERCCGLVSKNNPKGVT